MKQSRIKRLIPKKLAREIANANDKERPALEALASRESADAIAKMRSTGFRLVTRLESGEGVFVRESQVVGLHIHLPSSLYRALDAECRRRGATKRQAVTAALEQYLDQTRA